MLRADKGSRSTGSGQDTLPCEVRASGAKVNAKEEGRLGEDGLAERGGDTRDKLPGLTHRNVPKEHELRFGPIGAETEKGGGKI